MGVEHVQDNSPYQLVELLGAGGVGRVYLGEHRFLGVRHAVKVLHEEMTQDQEQVERFLNEARFSARLQHPHAVRVLNADRDNATGVLYTAMQYLLCLPMDALLDHVPLSPHRAVRYVWQILGALDYAHEAGGIKYEAILSAEELGLPVPRINLEKVSDNHLGAPLPPDFRTSRSSTPS